MVIEIGKSTYQCAIYNLQTRMVSQFVYSPENKKNGSVNKIISFRTHKDKMIIKNSLYVGVKCKINSLRPPIWDWWNFVVKKSSSIKILSHIKV